MGRRGRLTGTRSRWAHVVSAMVIGLLAVVATTTTPGARHASAAPVDDAVTAALPGGPPGQTAVVQFTPDGSHIVYLSTSQDADNVAPVWSVPVAGGTPVRLNPGFRARTDVAGLMIAPDSSFVVLWQERTPTGTSPQGDFPASDIWRVPITGGPATLVVDRFGGGIRGAWLADGGSRVVYLAAVGGLYHLLSAPTTGGASVRLNTDADAAISATDVVVAPDATHVVYRSWLGDGRYELWSAPVDGSSPSVRLHPALPNGGTVGQAMVTADGTRVVFVASLLDPGAPELFVVPITGGAPVRLNAALPPGGAVQGATITADSSHVVYLATPTDAGIAELLSVPIGGGAPTRLNGALPVGGHVRTWVLTANSQRAVYTADERAAGVVEVFSVPVTGGVPVRLNEDLPPGFAVDEPAAVTPDSARVLYSAVEAAGARRRLGYTVPVGGGPVTLLAGDPNTPAFGHTPAIVPDSQHLLYRTLDGVFVEPVTGGPVVRLNPDLFELAGGVRGLVRVDVSPDGAWVVYQGAQTRARKIGVYIVPTTGGVPRRVDIEALPAGASAVAATTPVRIFDSRPEEAAPGPKGIVGPDASVDVQVAGIGGVPIDATAVALNVTATDALAPGFVTVWPTGDVRPLASNINVTAPGQTRPNLVLVPLGVGGKVSMHAQSGAHLVADVTAWFTASSVVSAGRLLPLTPVRVFDTRADEPAPGPKGAVAAGGRITVQVAGVGGVPADAAAVVMNLTGTDAAGPGFVTVWPSGRPRPLASSLNLVGAGDTAANLVLVSLGTDGRLELYAHGGAQLLGDVTAYVTGAGAVADIGGLFVPMTPVRTFDSRPPTAPLLGRLGPGRQAVTIGGRTGVPADAPLVALNVTGTDAVTGFVTLFPALPMPLASTLNLEGPDDTRANAALVPLDLDGTLQVFVQTRANIVLDVAGFTVP